MRPSNISSYLSTNILAIDISSLSPMMYLSMDSKKCTSNADHTQDVYGQCSGALLPQASIWGFLLVIMAIKIVIAPLSTTTIKANDLIKLNLPRLLIFQGTLFGISFLLNLYLFANMEEGKATDSIITIQRTATSLAVIPLSLEIFHVILHREHRANLDPPQHSLTSPPYSEISLTPADTLSPNPTEGGVTDGFI